MNGQYKEWGKIDPTWDGKVKIYLSRTCNLRRNLIFDLLVNLLYIVHSLLLILFLYK